MSDRLTRVRAVLAKKGLGGLLISAPREEALGRANRRYLTGFTGSTGVVLVTETRALISADFRYLEQAQRESGPRGFEVFPAPGASKEWFPALLKQAGLGGKKLGLASGDMTYAGFIAIQKVVEELPDSDRPVLVATPGIVEQLRRVKDVEELATIQRAIDFGDAAFEIVADRVEPGWTEREVAWAVENEMRRAGAEGPSFDTIVATGPWGAMPHASPRAERIGIGEPLVIDMGARFGGYCSDLTRTIAVGEETPKFRAIYEIVFDAQQTAIERVETGMSGVQAHALAFDVIARHGYGEQFGHGLGHGIGLQVHEDPYLGPTSEDTLEEGMVFTIEPGIYIPGWGGIRLEDDVVLENGKARVLSHARKLTPAGVNP